MTTPHTIKHSGLIPLYCSKQQDKKHKNQKVESKITLKDWIETALSN